VQACVTLAMSRQRAAVEGSLLPRPASPPRPRACPRRGCVHALPVWFWLGRNESGRRRPPEPPRPFPCRPGSPLVRLLGPRSGREGEERRGCVRSSGRARLDAAVNAVLQRAGESDNGGSSHASSVARRGPSEALRS